jgi:hypothetical protein
MPVEAKRLFRPDVLRSHLSGFRLPPVDTAKLDHWAREISSGRIDRFGEQEILPHFLTDFLMGIRARSLATDVVGHCWVGSVGKLSHTLTGSCAPQFGRRSRRVYND